MIVTSNYRDLEEVCGGGYDRSQTSSPNTWLRRKEKKKKCKKQPESTEDNKKHEQIALISFQMHPTPKGPENILLFVPKLADRASVVYSALHNCAKRHDSIQSLVAGRPK
jgi:hypothetical protein